MFFGESRTVMAIAHEADVAAQAYLFDPIDGRGHLYSKLAKDLIGICSRYYDMDALFGATPGEAFRVEVAGANTIKDAAAGSGHRHDPRQDQQGRGVGRHPDHEGAARPGGLREE